MVKKKTDKPWKRKSRAKKNKPIKKDRALMRENRVKREEQRIADALERTVEALSPHNHLVTLSNSKFTKETVRELNNAFLMLYKIQHRPNHGAFSSDVEHSKKILDSVFENSHKGMRISSNVYFIPGFKTKSFEIKRLDEVFRTWSIVSIRVTAGDSKQFESQLIDRAVSIKNNFMRRAAAQKMKTQYTTSVSAKWINEKIVWLRQLAEAMGSKKAHRAIDYVSAERDRYCKKAGWNLPIFAEVQRVIMESSDLGYQESEVLKWVDWNNEDCLIAQMAPGTIARERMEKYALKFLASASAMTDSPDDEALSYSFRKSKTMLLEAADRWILPVDRSRRRHPYGDRQDETDFFPDSGPG